MEDAATLDGRGRGGGKPVPQIDALAARERRAIVLRGPLDHGAAPSGAMGFGSKHRRVYQEAEIDFMQQVAKQVAVAVDNVLHDESARSAQRQLTRERDRMRFCWK